MTRRDLLALAAKAGGINYAYRMMDSLDLVRKPEATDLASLDGSLDKRPSVLILGAGVAGMCAAYEFERLGFHCELLEARHRTGGRCVTIRRGDRSEETGADQICEFQTGEFFNPGPTRIPYWHITLEYCRKFKVPVAPFVNVNEGSYVYMTKSKSLSGQKIRMRDVIADTTGFVGEIATRSMKAGDLDKQLSDAEKTAALDYVRRFSFLDADGKYRGTRRRSFQQMPGGGPEKESYGPPLSEGDLLSAGFGGTFRFINAIDQQMTMLEVVGGVDGIARGFERHLHSPIRLGCQVSRIETGDHGVTVTYLDRTNGVRRAKADYCVCTIPLSVLKKIPHNFDSAATGAISRTNYGGATKVATEYKRRFWEEDEQVYGGITWTDMEIAQILYPCHNFFAPTGVLVNYAFDGFGQLYRHAPADRITAAQAQIAKIHPQAPSLAGSSVTVAWRNVPFNMGAYVDWEFTPNGEEAYQTLFRPQGRLYFAGEHMSRMTAWMAGSIESARYVVKEIATRAQVA